MQQEKDQLYVEVFLAFFFLGAGTSVTVTSDTAALVAGLFLLEDAAEEAPTNWKLFTS